MRHLRKRQALSPSGLRRFGVLWLGLLVPALPSPVRAEEDSPWMATRGRFYFFLDPEAHPDSPHQTNSLALFSVAGADGLLRAEPSGWVGRGANGVMDTKEPLSGDVRALVLQYGTYRAWTSAGRLLTTIGGTDQETLDGVSGGLRFGTTELAAVAARQGPDPRDAFGNAWVFGAEAAGETGRTWRLGLGGRHRRTDEANPDTQFTGRLGYFPSDDFDVTARATAGAETTSLAQARLEAVYRVDDDLSLDVFAQRVDIRAMLPPDELLAVFAHDDRNEAGARADWTVLPTVVLHADAAAIYGVDRGLAGSGRLGADWRPRMASVWTGDWEQRIDAV